MTTMRILAATALLALGANTALAADTANGFAQSAADGAARTVYSGSCTGMTAIDYKSDSNYDASTLSASFVSVPNATFAFNQGAPGCAVVSFTTEAFAPANRVILVRARLDGATNAAPGVVQFNGDDDEDGDGRWGRTHGFTFVFPSVAAGAHSVTIEYRSGTDGRRVFIGKHTTVVQHP